MNNKNLLAKTILIVAVLIVFLFGIIGIPEQLHAHRASRTRCRSAFTWDLTLKGGTHLILQVQVNDAVNADTDRAVERLKDASEVGQRCLRRDHEAESAAES